MWPWSLRYWLKKLLEFNIENPQIFIYLSKLYRQFSQFPTASLGTLSMLLLSRRLKCVDENK